MLTFEIAISTPFEDDFYKRWVTNDSAIIFALDRDLPAYRIRQYDCATMSFSEWDCPVELKPCARTMPVRYFGRDGQLQSEEVVYVGASLELSPDRKRICWLGTTGEWIAGNSDLTECRRYSREGEEDYCLGAIWLPDSLHWAEPYCSQSYKSLVEVDMYTLGEDEPALFEIENLRFGDSIGTTMRGEAIIVHRDSTGRTITSPTEVRAVSLSRLDLYREELRAVRRTIKLPMGYGKSDICLAPNSERLAWLLYRRWDAEGSHALWVTDLAGKEITPPNTIEPDKIELLVGPSENNGQHPTDLEWLPDESGVSFIYGRHVLNLTMPPLS